MEKKTIENQFTVDIERYFNMEDIKRMSLAQCLTGEEPCYYKGVLFYYEK